MAAAVEAGAGDSSREKEPDETPSLFSERRMLWDRTVNASLKCFPDGRIVEVASGRSARTVYCPERKQFFVYVPDCKCFVARARIVFATFCEESLFEAMLKWPWDSDDVVHIDGDVKNDNVTNLALRTRTRKRGRDREDTAFWDLENGLESCVDHYFVKPDVAYLSRMPKHIFSRMGGVSLNDEGLLVELERSALARNARFWAAALIESFFGIVVKDHGRFGFLDGDESNLSLSNLVIDTTV